MPHNPDYIEIAVRNRSSLTNERVMRMTAAVNRQVQFDFSPYWGQDASVDYDARPERADWLIDIVDDSTFEGAAGWHTIEDGTGRVIAEVAVNQPFEVSTVLSHEVLEMLANQAVAKTVTNWRSTSDRSQYALEVCDPVQATSYMVDEFPVSDFVLPAWFAADTKDGAKTAFITKGLAPFQVAPGGYAIAWSNTWEDRTIFRHLDGKLSQSGPMIASHVRTDFLRSALS